VDANWLARKKESGPSAEDQKLLLPAQPLVKLQPVASMTPDYKSNILKADVDKISLTTNYALSINLDTLFGPLFIDEDSYRNERRKRYGDVLDVIGAV